MFIDVNRQNDFLKNSAKSLGAVNFNCELELETWCIPLGVCKGSNDTFDGFGNVKIKLYRDLLDN